MPSFFRLVRFIVHLLCFKDNLSSLSKMLWWKIFMNVQYTRLVCQITPAEGAAAMRRSNE